MSDWYDPESADVKSKVIDAKNWRGSANLSVGEDTMEIPFRMLPEKDRLPITSRINMEAIVERQQDDDTVDEERLLELQEKDELSSEEEDELEALTIEVAKNRASIMSDLGEETFEALIEAGEKGVYPDEEDVDNAMDMMPKSQCRRFEDVPGSEINSIDDLDGLTRSDMEQAIHAEMVAVLDGSPYPILFTLGQQVLRETQSAGGNSSDDLGEALSE